MISVLILTKDEEINIGQCMQSVSWSDDVVVFDSESTDRTTEIAASRGARVVSRRFDNYSAQREAARQLEYKYPWVLAIDADERPDDELVAQLRLVAGNHDSHANSEVVAYRFRRKDHFMGKWIKHSTLYPSWFLRFYRPERIKYGSRAVHEYPTVDGKIGELSGHLLHYSFNKGLEDWLLKHVRYSRFEAIEILKGRADKNTRLDLRGLLAIRDPIRRRQALKQLSLHVPFRPLLRFLHLYAVRGGFLDGIAGYRYCRMLAMYESMIQFHVKDLSSRATPAGVEVQISSLDGRNGLPPDQGPVGLASARAEAMLIKPATRP